MSCSDCFFLVPFEAQALETEVGKHCACLFSSIHFLNPLQAAVRLHARAPGDGLQMPRSRSVLGRSLRDLFVTSDTTGRHPRIHCPFVLLSLFSTSSVVVQSLSGVQFFAAPWTAARQAPLSSTVSWNLLRFMPVESVMPSNYPILCCLSSGMLQSPPEAACPTPSSGSALNHLFSFFNLSLVSLISTQGFNS